MELRSSIAFIGDLEILESIDNLINEETILNDTVFSVDFISDLETSDTYVYRCDVDGDSWVNIYEIQEILDKKLNSTKKFDIIYASTDAKSYVDVVSFSGNFDAYVDSDLDKIQEVCETYGLEFYGNVDSDDVDYYDDEEEDSYY